MENTEVTREEFDDLAKLTTTLKQLDEERATKTAAEIAEIRDKVAETHRERTRKRAGAVMAGEEQEGEFPKFESRAVPHPLVRAQRTTRAAEKTRANADRPFDEAVLEYQQACEELNFLRAYFEKRDGVNLRVKGPNDTELINTKAMEGYAPKTLARARYYGNLLAPYYRTNDAMSSGSGEDLADWIETGWSGQMMDLVRTAYIVADQFVPIAMPQRSYDLPLEGTDLTPYLIGEQTKDPTSESATAFTVSSSTTDKVTLTAKKFAVRCVLSDEANEDSIVPMMPYLSRKHALAHAFAVDECITDGQPSAQIDTGISGGSMGSTDYRMAWDGLRYIAHSVKTSATKDMNTFDADNLAKLRGMMGKYGTNVRDLVFITSYSGLAAFIQVSAIQTIDVYGPYASIATGYAGGPISPNEVGRVYGIPVILVGNTIWEQMNASGIYDNSTTSFTCLILANKTCFALGNRTGYTYKVLNELYAPYGAIGVVSYARHAFSDLHSGATDLDVVYGYNIAKAA